MSQSICLYLHLHQPWRLSPSRRSAPPADWWHGPENSQGNEAVFRKVAAKSYLPTLEILLSQLQAGEITLTLSITGTLLEQCLAYPEYGAPVLSLLQRMVATGRLELLAETYYHSLSYLYSPALFITQVRQHVRALQQHFGVTPQVFRHTELLYRDDLSTLVRAMGFAGIMAEGWHTALPDPHATRVRSAHLVPLEPAVQALAEAFRREVFPQQSVATDYGVLTKHYRLSDDIAFRFSHQPLTSEQFAHRVQQTWGESVNICMDFETFGEHQWEDTGIFAFLQHLPAACRAEGISFRTATETLRAFPRYGSYRADDWVSWADTERDLSAWRDNQMQHDALAVLAELEQRLRALQTARPDLNWTPQWEKLGRLSTSDHVYYMSTKYFSDGDVHTYFSPYKDPYEAYVYFRHASDGFAQSLRAIAPPPLPTVKPRPLSTAKRWIQRFFGNDTAV